MAQAETEIRVACRWCGFFSKPSSACDVCGSPLPTDAPRVPLEVARAAVFSRADPISILEEPREPTRRSCPISSPAAVLPPSAFPTSRRAGSI